MVKIKIPQIACLVLKQYCHKSVLRIKEKLKKMDLTSLVSTEIKLTKVYIYIYIFLTLSMEMEGYKISK